MPDKILPTGAERINEKWTELPDGTYAKQVIQVNADGTTPSAAKGRAAASSSAPVVLSNEDKSALDATKNTYTSNGGVYVNNTTRTAGRGILANITTGGTATLTFGGTDIAFTFAAGPTILPLAITKTVLGTAVGTFYAIS